jgi:predicted nucleotidyltransferase
MMQDDLNNVERERNEAISIIRNLVRQAYPEHQYLHTRIGVTLYGSMASGLAIDKSDIDLAVTGHSFHGNKDTQVTIMYLLVKRLEVLSCKNTLQFIESATIPVIKMELDLQKIREMMRPQYNKKEMNIIPEHMRFIGLDLTFEDMMADEQWQSNVNLGIKCISYVKQL